VLFVGVACGDGGRTAQTQPWAQERLQREETDDQRKGEPEGSREEVAHALASLDAEILLPMTATERTVKVHQSRTSKKTAGLCGVHGPDCSELETVTSPWEKRRACCIRLLSKSLSATSGSVHTQKRAAIPPNETLQK
jgi:hypothetical protein